MTPMLNMSFINQPINSVATTNTKQLEFYSLIDGVQLHVVITVYQDLYNNVNCFF